MLTRFFRRLHLTRKYCVAFSVGIFLIVALWLTNSKQHNDDWPNKSVEAHQPAEGDKTQTNERLTSCLGASCNRLDQRSNAIDVNGFEWCQELSGMPRPSLHEEPQTWQNVDGRNLTVFSAYLDARENIGGPLVRVIASGLQASFNEIGVIYCQMWYPDIDIPVTFGPATYDLIYPSTLHGEMWVAHFVLCPLPSTKLVPGTPFAVSITAQRCSKKAGNQLMVMTRKQQLPSYALCLPVIYGRYLRVKHFTGVSHKNTIDYFKLEPIQQHDD
jgi:hypothetical protein